MTRSTGMGELRKVMDRTMRTHGRPQEIWSDGGPPYNGHEWEEYLRDWGTIPRKTTPYHPPANGMVERFNQVLKQTILTAYAERKDPVEEVDKLVAAYRNTPHTVTEVKPSMLMFNRDISTKLPRFTATPKGRHHRKARQKDSRAKTQMKQDYDRKHRTRTVEIKPGDWAYIRRKATSSTKGPWDPIPYQITHGPQNQITGTRQGEEKTRDRSDWKLLVARPAHLKAYQPKTRTVSAPPETHQPTNGWEDDDNWDDCDDQPRRPLTRAAKRAATQQQQQPRQHDQTRDGHQPDPTPAPDQPNQQPQQEAPEPEHEYQPDSPQPGPSTARTPPPTPPPPPPPNYNRHLCPICHMMVKL